MKTITFSSKYVVDCLFRHFEIYKLGLFTIFNEVEACIIFYQVIISIIIQKFFLFKFLNKNFFHFSN